MDESITNYYQADHDRLDQLFRQFQMTKNQDLSKAGEFFDQFQSGLKRHILWEEEILFPIFEDKTGIRDVGPTAVMRMEHKMIVDYLEQIHLKIQEGSSDTDGEEASLLSTLSQHNQKEENILYPNIDRLLNPQERSEIYEKMEEISKSRALEYQGVK